MGEFTKIEWATHTFNPWTGCSKVSAACKNCYAESWAKRSGLVRWGDDGERRRTSESNWRQPLKWEKWAQGAGVRGRVFCASLADVFEDHATIMPGWRADLGRLILNTPNLDWLLLTKRPENVMRFAADFWTYISGVISELPKNVWVGTTVEDQQMADKRIPELLKVPAHVRFLSCEPLLGPIDLRQIHWVIVGGESGPSARPMHPDWARSLRDQCQAAHVPFFFKQHGEWLHWSQAKRWKDSRVADWEAHGAPITGFTDDRVHIWGDNTHSYRVGKKNAGRLLDGREHNEFPEVSR